MRWISFFWSSHSYLILLDFLLPLDTLTITFPLLCFSDCTTSESRYMWSSIFCLICVFSRNDTTIQSSTSPQLWGPYRLSIEHICSTGQLRQGAESIQSILIGNLVGISLSPPSLVEGFHSFDKQTLLKKDCYPRAFSAT
jgi:hypothetical protein